VHTRCPAVFVSLLTLSAITAVIAGCAGSSNGDGGLAEKGDNSGPTTSQAADEDDSRSRASDAARRFPLDSLPTATVTVNGHTLRVWLAQDFDEQRDGVVQEGLMHVPPEEIEDDQGMLFVFTSERVRGFWMLNTITPLDIAFVRANGTIVTIWQMPPLTLRTFSSFEPVMFALEVKQGTLARLGVKEGDQMLIPASVFEIR
jgi:uncharacterized membrane protein (UPF0127 family)